MTPQFTPPNELLLRWSLISSYLLKVTTHWGRNPLGQKAPGRSLDRQGNFCRAYTAAIASSFIAEDPPLKGSDDCKLQTGCRRKLH